MNFSLAVEILVSGVQKISTPNTPQISVFQLNLALYKFYYLLTYIITVI